MRQLLIDTETTGLEPKQGHRIIELAAVEVVDRRLTGRHRHYRVDPERDIDFAATEVHGLTRDDLRGKPRFADIAPEFVDFARGAEWIIHNAPFDVAFFDVEFDLCGLPRSNSIYGRLVDTLALARETFPGKRNSLDALCERFGVSNAHRTLHGALLDAQLLAEVYLAMTRGQETLIIDMHVPSLIDATRNTARDSGADGRPRYIVHCVVPDAAELAAHRAYLETLASESKSGCLWLEVEREAETTADGENDAEIETAIAA
ncbi:MAG TPA: DNA polymerase III subunit epsilon [Casimicrobiaceae bacterium]|nr:DNA polymerase III subunit epsilon [Casimicrobiaceae bacterium]